MLGQLVLSGLAQGGAYSLVGLGMTLLYRSTGILNFAHGEFFMVSAYVAYICLTIGGLGFIPAIVVTILAALALGALIEISLIRKLNSASHFQQVVMTVAIAYLLRGLVRAYWGYDILRLPPMGSWEPFEIGGLIVTPQDIIILGVSVLIVLIFFVVLQGTRAGRMVLAVSESPRAALLMGINVPRFNSSMWALAAALGGLAGIMVAPITLLYPDMGAQVVLRAIAAMTLGGLGSFPGVVVGGLAVGVIQSVVSGYVSSSLTEISSLIVIVLVLLIRPEGLFGAKEYVRV